MKLLLHSSPVLASRVQDMQGKLLVWLQCGIEPRQLAFTLALGFAVGCIPLVGATTAICAVFALLLRLNMPAIQAANWIAMPLQVVLLIPFLRLGQWLFPAHSIPLDRSGLMAQIATAPWHSLMQMGGLFAHGLLAWLIMAGPALVLMTLLLTPVMHRVSKLAALQVAAGD